MTSVSMFTMLAQLSVNWRRTYIWPLMSSNKKTQISPNFKDPSLLSFYKLIEFTSGMKSQYHIIPFPKHILVYTTESTSELWSSIISLSVLWGRNSALFTLHKSLLFRTWCSWSLVFTNNFNLQNASFAISSRLKPCPLLVAITATERTYTLVSQV